MDSEWLKLEGPSLRRGVWSWTPTSELQCLACLHSEQGAA